MNPRTGEILAMANEPTFNPNAYRDFPETASAQSRRPGPVRAGLHVQDRHGFRRDRRTRHADRHVDRYEPRRDPRRRRRHRRIPRTQLRRAVVHRRDRQVEQRRRDQDWASGRQPQRLSRYVQRFGFGRPISPDFPGESPGIVWDPAKWTDRALASVSMGYQVGVTPLQMVAAVSSIANGGELVEPRVVRAMYRDNRRYAVRPKVLRRTVSRETAAVLTTIMEGVVDARNREARADSRLHGRRQDRHGLEADRRALLRLREQRVVRRVSPVARSGAGDHRGDRLARTPGGNSGGMVSAPIFQRIAEATLRYLGVAPTVDPGARRCWSRADDPSAPLSRPQVRNSDRS